MRFLYRMPILIILFLSMQTVWACMTPAVKSVQSNLGDFNYAA